MPLAPWSVPLASPPDLIYSGVGRHGGDEPSHFYQLADLWALHLYDYEGTLETGGETCPIQKGSISLIRPGVGFRHSWSGPESVHVYYLFKLPEPARGFVTIPVIQKRPPASLGHFEFQAGDAVRFLRDRARATARLWDLLFSISVSDESMSSRIPAPVRQAMDVIERNLHRKMRASELARRVGLSHNQLTRLFQQHLGRSILEYLADLRWERISRLLTNTQIASKQIAYEFCFSDLSHFNKFVRRRAGMSPRALRAQTPPFLIREQQ